MPALNQKKSASLAAAATLTLDVPVTGLQYLHVITQVGAGAALVGDNITKAVAYLTNSGAGTSPALGGTPVPQPSASSTTFAATIAWVHTLYVVDGLEKVQIQVTNNNAGTLPAQIDVFGS